MFLGSLCCNHMDPGQSAPSRAVWTWFMVFASMIKSSMKCFWVYAIDVESRRHFQGDKCLNRLFCAFLDRLFNKPKSHVLSQCALIFKPSISKTCADPESFVRGGPTLIRFFFFFRERLQRLPKAGDYRPASETPWRFAGGPIMAHRWMLTWQLCDFQGIRTSITREPYKFVIFKGGGGPDPLSPPPPLWIRTWKIDDIYTWLQLFILLLLILHVIQQRVIDDMCLLSVSLCSNISSSRRMPCKWLSRGYSL